MVSIDIPSGLFADQPITKGEIIKADFVVSFQTPKLAFLLPQSGKYCGKVEIVDIGLHRDFLIQEQTNLFTLEARKVFSQLQKRKRFGYKNQYGHGLLMAGSFGKMGAAILASRASLKSGVGLLTTHIPACGYQVFQTSVPEAMASVDSSDRFIQTCPEIDKYDAIAIGPGLDRDVYTADVLITIFKNFKKPIVLDADALNILSDQRELIDVLPANTILTPHPGEFRRLAGPWENDFDRLKLQKQWSIDHQVIIVLKGANTSISLPNGTIYFNTTGNPGMATAGSGDVLTGVILGLLCQGYSPVQSAVIGVFVHGLAGDLGVNFLGEISLTAGDIIEYLPMAFLHDRQ